MRNKSFFYLFFFLVSLLACSNPTVFINPDYSDKIINNAILAIIPPGNADVIITEEVSEELSLTKTEDSLIIFLYDVLMVLLKEKSTFNNIYQVELTQDIEYEQKEFGLYNDTLTFSIPKKNLSFGIDEGIYLFVIDNLEFKFDKRERDPTSPGKTFSVSGRSLSTKEAKLQLMHNYDYYFSIALKYCIVDNQKMEEVCFGNIETIKQYKFIRGIDETIKEVIVESALKIINNTPFEKSI
jgi:hypothetical protein